MAENELGLDETTFNILKRFIEKEEGRRNKVYIDTVGRPTVGVGHNIAAKGLPPDMEEELNVNNELSDESIDRLLTMDLIDAAKETRQIFGNTFDKLSPNRQIALISMAFQLGGRGLAKFRKMRQAIIEGDFERAGMELLDSKLAREQAKNRAARLFKLIVDNEMPFEDLRQEK